MPLHHTGNDEGRRQETFSYMLGGHYIWARMWKTWLTTIFKNSIADFRLHIKNSLNNATDGKLCLLERKFSQLFNEQSLMNVTLSKVFLIADRKSTIEFSKNILNHVFHRLAHIR